MLDIAYVAIGACTGLAVGLTGMGAGALMTPILLLFFDVPPTTAVATDLWFAALTKLASAHLPHTRQHADWQVIKRLWWGSLPVALLTVLLIHLGATWGKVQWLSQAIGVMVLFTALTMLIRPWLRMPQAAPQGQCAALQAPLTVLGGGVLGLCVALTSIGAGTLGSMLLLFLYPQRMAPHRLVATDIVHSIPLAAVAGLGYLFAGLVDGAMLAALLAGSIPAIIVANLLAGKIPGRVLQLGMAAVLLAAGFKLLS